MTYEAIEKKLKNSQIRYVGYPSDIMVDVRKFSTMAVFKNASGYKITVRWTSGNFDHSSEYRDSLEAAFKNFIETFKRDNSRHAWVLEFKGC
jgi:hypothetical protein